MKQTQQASQAHDSVRKAARWAWGLFFCAAVFLIVAVVFLLVQTTGNHEFYSQYFGWLVGINITIALLIFVALIWATFRLVVRLRQGRFGSKLLVKLAAIFALVGIFPGLLVYVVSYQFVSRSIETWFDVRVEGALSAGLQLGQVSYEAQASDLANRTQAIAEQLSRVSETTAIEQMGLVRQQLNVDDVMLLTLDGAVLGAAGRLSFSLTSPDQLTAEQRRALMQQNVMTLEQRSTLAQQHVIYGIDDNEDGTPIRMWAVAVVRPSIYDVTGKVRILRVYATMPSALATNAQLVQNAYREYQERALGRDGLRRMYIGTLTLALFLAVFGAVALAVMLGQQLIRPLLILVEGVKQVGAGDLSPKQFVQTHDELGGLTYAFADMTNQLRDANELAAKSLKQVADARAHLQTILDNLTTGVIELDNDGAIHTINPGAIRILQQELKSGAGLKLENIPVLRAFGESVHEHFSTLPFEQSAYWQETFELANLHDDEIITIVARGAWLSGTKKLLVIDDISDIISAQRSVAWGEVARRLAHEIKNPLTPIQLSAERIEHKFAGKLDEADRAILQRSVKMIVDQVDAMKRLVNEFREYARLPVAELKPLNLNALVHDIIQLYVGAQQKNKGLHVAVELEADLPMIKGDAAQLRQVMHNLLQNALDAVEDQPEQNIEVLTEYRPTQTGSLGSGCVCLCVRDSGKGFPEKVLKRAFEPYVTSKAKGTGLGLAVVKKIMDEHSARIDIGNVADQHGNIMGAQVLLSFPVWGVTPDSMDEVQAS